VITSTKPCETVNAATGGFVLLFAATLFLSSLLMFALEPIVAKTVLPILGGTPMVWNTCVLFFQILLLGGYAYAHGVTTWLGPRLSGAAYGVVLVLPFATLPFAIGPDVQPPTGSNPIGWLLLVLVKSIGLPFFALAATAPMLQRWFADTDHPSAKDPYFLYAASNLGSLLALVMYPVIVEPALRLRMQNSLWAIGYGVFVLAAGVSVVAGWRRKVREAGVPAQPVHAGDAAAADSLTWERRATWIALAFIPSSLMLAVTTYFSTDIAPVPLFWIAPLALYLLTFVAAFGTRAAALRSIADRFMPLVVLPLVVLMVARVGLPLALAIPLHLGAFTLAALVCHGRLAALRPDPAHLTEFYFWIAFGGMLGGMFNTLAAPLLFSQIVEYPLVLVLALAARGGRQKEAASSWSLNDLLVPMGVGALCIGVIVWHPGRDTNMLFVASLGVPAFVAFTQSKAAMRFAASVATMLVAGSLAANAQGQALHVSRTFFGVYRVTTDQERRHHSLFHGTTLHGMQALDPAHQSEPLTYFNREGPIGQAFAGLPAATTTHDVAVVGLGIGTLASYRTPGQQWTFYEIDPEVERIARAGEYFTYMRSCGDGCRVVLGDARLSLARAPLHGYGVIVLDAFSSDAIPIHLMTAEALGLYLSRLAPGGALAFHISNRHLNLAPVLARTALSHGLAVRLQRHNTDQRVTPELFSSTWMVMARNAADLGPLAADARWSTPAIPPSTPLWTDDFSNIVSVLNLRAW
jgi:spermidine synthase